MLIRVCDPNAKDSRFKICMHERVVIANHDQQWARIRDSLPVQASRPEAAAPIPVPSLQQDKTPIRFFIPVFGIEYPPLAGECVRPWGKRGWKKIPLLINF
jgi:hypothetical protein